MLEITPLAQVGVEGTRQVMTILPKEITSR
jgi:hypothetical protein